LRTQNEAVQLARKQSKIEHRTGPGGESAFIAGTRIRVSDIARLYSLMESEILTERIPQALPSLSPEQVKAAITYWRSNPQEIDQEIEEEDAILRELPSRM
jgi:uncharacterized protein (DUF433 family)